MYCQKCGARLKAQERFCGRCSTDSRAPDRFRPLLPVYAGGRQRTMRCEHCGSPLEADDVFCGSCGKKAGGFGRLQCVFCGKQTDPDARFCEHCGVEYRVSADGKLERRDADGKPERFDVCCPSCHAPLEGISPYCPSCGCGLSSMRERLLAAITSDGKLTCPVCGEGNQRTNRNVCWSCGVSFVSNSNGEFLFCRSCGRAYPSRLDACPGCGLAKRAQAPEEAEAHTAGKTAASGLKKAGSLGPKSPGRSETAWRDREYETEEIIMSGTKNKNGGAAPLRKFALIALILTILAFVFSQMQVFAEKNIFTGEAGEACSLAEFDSRAPIYVYIGSGIALLALLVFAAANNPRLYSLGMLAVLGNVLTATVMLIPMAINMAGKKQGVKNAGYQLTFVGVLCLITAFVACILCGVVWDRAKKQSKGS